ncbi:MULTISPECIES: hypothetical protein [unclassified Flavobacterium]|uniref:hypothetical protein n=1 Tax=unclassified Flavobacterium TaxID=196869 RepID=UPI001F13756B|nr:MULTISPECIES: hypothetical protein [unclassified Flavobacterium]UMY64735.1 hypothetical protein MKO97_09440 [Flavobacterium sp. HJ-32-4]
MNFLELLRERSGPFFWFGLLFLVLAVVCLVATRLSDQQVLGVNAYYKPFKFFVSSWLFAWTMGWYCGYLQAPTAVMIYTWFAIGVLCFQDFYILIQAARGLRSHFYVETPFYSGMFSLMAVTSVSLAFATLWIAALFFSDKVVELPQYYLWSIRFGLLLFVVFALQGLLMGARGSHLVGAPDDAPGIRVLNWSRQVGDLRIAHFLGMHALQLLPLVGGYVIRNTKGVAVFALLYLAVCIFSTLQALQGRPFLRL